MQIAKLTRNVFKNCTESIHSLYKMAILYFIIFCQICWEIVEEGSKITPALVLPWEPRAVVYAAPLCAQSYPNISQPSSTDPKIKLHLTRWERFKVEFLFHPGPPNTRLGMSMSRLIRGSCIVNWEILQKFPFLEICPLASNTLWTPGRDEYSLIIWLDVIIPTFLTRPVQHLCYYSHCAQGL